ESLTGWLAGTNADWLPALIVLMLGPVLLIAGRVKRSRPTASRWGDWCGQSARSASQGHRIRLAAGFVFVLAFGASWGAGQSWKGFPPAYHDEFSYLFQAETYLQGRWWLPSHPRHPEWFDQMHVLNEGHFASRYFPGVGF